MKKASLWACAGLMLGLLGVQALSAARAKSATADEFHHHVASGYSYWKTGNFKMNPASPPFSRLLTSLPLVFMDAKAPLEHASWKAGDSPEFARQFFYHANDRVEAFVFWSRVPIVLLSLVFGLAVFLFSRRLFGDVGGLFSLVLYSFCPDILAHSALATTDLAVAYFFFLTLMTFHSYLKNPSTAGVVRTGVAAGLTFLSKFSAALLFPTLLVAALAAAKPREIGPRRTLLFLTVCLLTIWAGYFFEVKPLLQDTPDPLKKEAMYEKIGGPALLRFAREAPVPLSTFASAFVSMGFTRSAGVDAYLLGEWSRDGWWYYYFAAFLFKNTVPFILFSILGLVLVPRIAVDRVTAAVLAVPAAVFFAATLGDKAQAGIRYFLPVYPFLFVLGGGVAAMLFKRSKALKVLVLLLMTWHVREALWISPDFLAYFNVLGGGPANGYRVLRDSNIDWGQDLKGLGSYVEREGLKEVVLSSVMGSPDPRLPVRWAGPEELTTPSNTVYAIGAHHLDRFQWTSHEKPALVIGHSLFVYDFRGRKGGPDV